MNRQKRSDLYHMREDVLARSKKKCVYCGRSLSTVDMTIDHIHPFILGGSDDISNLAAACRSCNSSKNDKSVEEFMGIGFVLDIDDSLIAVDDVPDLASFDTSEEMFDAAWKYFDKKVDESNKINRHMLGLFTTNDPTLADCMAIVQRRARKEPTR